jgi:hypothetical protein
MELIPLIPLTSIEKKHKNYNSLNTRNSSSMQHINYTENIPRLSLKNIRSRFFELPETEQKKMLALKTQKNTTLEQSLTFNIALFKEETLIPKILTLMMDGDAISAKLFYEAPLWYAQSRYHSAKKMLARSSLTKQPAFLLFRLPTDQQKELIGIITPTLSSQIIDGSTIVINQTTEEEIQSYDKEIQEHFFANEDIRVITNTSMNESDHKQSNAQSLVFVATIVGTVVTIILRLTVPSLKWENCIYNNSSQNHPNAWKCGIYPVISSIFFPLATCTVVSAIIAYYYHKKTVNEKAQLISI